MRIRWTGVAVAALVVAAAIGGCGSSGGSGSSGALDKYTQTWGKAYSDTTCSEWHSQMSDAQQWAAAADMLTGARNKGDGGDGLPPDDLVDEFQDGVTNACVIDSHNVAEIGAALYLTERARFRP
jgi:hypothetical protein